MASAASKKKKIPNPPRRCLFCDKRGKSEEHVFADWLARMVPRAPNQRHHTWIGDRTSVKRGLGHGRIVVRTLKEPCINCNNKWMGSIENANKPVLLQLMHGNPYALDQDEQRLLATWLTIKAMVWDRAQKKRAVSKSDRDYVYENRTPPPNWRVWVGRADVEFGYSGVFSAIARLYFERADGSVWPEPTEDPIGNTQSFMIFSGAFVGIAVGSVLLDSDIEFEAGELFKPIWPCSDVVSWPPPYVLAAEDEVLRNIPDRFIDAIRAGLP